MASDATLLGAAGEHYVMAELLRRGFIAALAPQGVPNADIVVTDISGSRLCSVQVKTRRDIGADGGWHMSAKHEKIIGSRLFYCFVDFGRAATAAPTVHVVPASVVAEAVKSSHAAWLAAPGKNGHVRKDTKMRRFLPDYGKVFGGQNPYPDGWLRRYLNAWQLLGLEEAAVEAESDS